MTETEKPKPAPQKPQPGANIARLQKLYEELPETDRERLAQAGVAIPLGDLSAIATGDHKWGLRCTKCNKVALYFIGTEWMFGEEKVDVPPALPEIAWTQHLHPDQIDRHSPRCQHCGVVLPKLASGAFDYGRELLSASSGRSRLVIVKDFQLSRDKSFDKKNLRALKREINSKSVDASGISAHYNLEPREPSKVLDATHGVGFSKQLEEVAQATGAADYVPSRS